MWLAVAETPLIDIAVGILDLALPSFEEQRREHVRSNLYTNFMFLGKLWLLGDKVEVP